MHRATLKKITVLVLFLVLSLSAFGLGAYPVKADAGGTGKYLEIEFMPSENLGLCYVTATKIDSGQVFTFEADNSATYSQKVGAGTVLLEAWPDEDNGWTFSHWTIDEIPKYVDTIQYKTVKYGKVYAYFERKTVDITVSVQMGLGSISYAGEEVATPGNPGIVPVPFGSEPIFTFESTDNHLSAAIIDWNTETEYFADLVLTEFATSYQFPPVKTDHTLDAFFSANGEAYVPTGSNVNVFLSSEASLFFGSVGTSGTARGRDLDLQFDPADLVVWEITLLEVQFNGNSIVALRYDDSSLPEGFDESSLRMYRGEFNFEDFEACDFNDDGKIDGQDVSAVANAAKQDYWYDETYDVYPRPEGDGKVNEDDIHFVNSMKNALDNIAWVDITLRVDVINNIIYGVTDHFSIFRAR